MIGIFLTLTLSSIAFAADCERHLAGNPFTPRQILARVESAQEYWQREFALRGWPYEIMHLSIFSGQSYSMCGEVRGGPMYCSLDRTMYIDPTFFASAHDLLGEETDGLLAFVVAHEIGHHVQHLRGYPFRRELLPALEGQADCLAALYLRDMYLREGLGLHDVRDAIRRATLAGDDHIAYVAARTGRKLKEDSYPHGTSFERAAWMVRGLLSGKLEACGKF